MPSKHHTTWAIPESGHSTCQLLHVMPLMPRHKCVKGEQAVCTFFSYNGGDGTQGLAHAKQAPNH